MVARSKQRPRELRRRVMITARLRVGGAWGDAFILNISSRGLLIQSSCAAPPGSIIFVHRGRHAIAARVVWRQGLKAGLSAEDRVPVEEIVGAAQVPALQITAAGSRVVERRRKPRSAEQNRVRGRCLEFAATAGIGAVLAAGFSLIAAEALAKPLAAVRSALGG